MLLTVLHEIIFHRKTIHWLQGFFLLGYISAFPVTIYSANPRKLVTDMNVQAFFQQTSSRVLYTMTSKAHGYGVEEAITLSSKSAKDRQRRRYIQTPHCRCRHRNVVLAMARRLSCQIPHEWNCCQQLPNASLSFSSSFAVTLLDLTRFCQLKPFTTSSDLQRAAATPEYYDKFKQIGKQIQVRTKATAANVPRAPRAPPLLEVVCGGSRQLYDRHRKRGTNVLLKG